MSRCLSGQICSVLESVDDLVDVIVVLFAEPKILVEIGEAHLTKCLHDLCLVDVFLLLGVRQTVVDVFDALFDFLAVVNLADDLCHGICALELVRLWPQQWLMLIQLLLERLLLVWLLLVWLLHVKGPELRIGLALVHAGHR